MNYNFFQGSGSDTWPCGRCHKKWEKKDRQNRYAQLLAMHNESPELWGPMCKLSNFY